MTGVAADAIRRALGWAPSGRITFSFLISPFVGILPPFTTVSITLFTAEMDGQFPNSLFPDRLVAS